VVGAACLLASPIALFAQASIEGVVTLPQTRSAPVVTQRYAIVSNGGVIATSPPVAVVYLAGDFPKPATPPVRQILQRGLDFEPRLLPIQVGTNVEFPNLDDTYHNVFSYSRPKRFDLGRYRKDEEPVPAQVFDTPGLVTLRCDIHEHMRAVILVLETPHFVISDTDGRFRLTNLPPGNYTLKAWIDSRTTVERPVALSADAAMQVNLP
jgi:plastocyanin